MYVYKLHRNNVNKNNVNKNNNNNNDNNDDTNITINNEQCAPNIKNDGISCLSLEKLIKIVNAYNDNAKKNNKNQIIIKNNKKYLIKELTSRLKDVCKSQVCWLNLNFVKLLNDKDIQEYTFRPVGPRDVRDWLSTLDIDNIINQYYKIYFDFIFFGAIPIDFDDLPQLGIKDLDFNKLINDKKTKIGIVFNLDEHYKSGSHWVALYADIDPNKDNYIYYFDSYGIPPEKRIKILIDRIYNFCSNNKQSFKKQNGGKLNKIVKYEYNNIRHQFKGSECGVYSINFILRLLKGEKFKDITTNITTDDEISKCRQVYFNKL
jgi:hypothetical protein